MMILCQTATYLVEYQFSILTIARYSDGHCKALQSRGIRRKFENALNHHGPQYAIRTHLKLCNDQSWRPFHDPKRMPR